ncbi:MAG: peptidoglycan DD-metalloendopeptidase family protein, partial [Cyanobacteria bacterium J06638_38]
DYFFNLGQRIKEAQVETERLIKQIFYQDIKSQLKRAIAPGSESFINGIIDGIQSLLDQAQQIFEQTLGLKTGRIQFESEAYSNEQQMVDFMRQVRGASDALLDFRNNLVSSDRSSISTSPTANNAVAFPLPKLTLDSATITSGYGWRNIFGRKDFHEGIDIAAAGGTDVLAVRDGVVKHIKPLADQMQVAIESVNAAGQKVTEWFIHLGQNLDVAVGDRITSGQKIGEVANTSAYARSQRVSTGDHLDYRVKVDGAWVDPKTMLNNSSVGVNKGGSRTIYNDPNVINRQLENEKLRGLDLQEILGSYGLPDLQAEVLNQKEKIQRQFQIEGIQEQNKFADLLDKVASLKEQSQLSTLDIETARELRQAAAEFRNFKFEGMQQLQALTDQLASLQGITEIFPDAIAQLEENGTPEALAIVPVFQQILAEAETAIPRITEDLEKTAEAYKAIAEEEQKRIAFIKEQGILKKRIAEITKQEEL